MARRDTSHGNCVTAAFQVTRLRLGLDLGMLHRLAMLRPAVAPSCDQAVDDTWAAIYAFICSLALAVICALSMTGSETHIMHSHRRLTKTSG